MGTLNLTQQAAPGTPAAGTSVIYSKTDGLLYWKDDAGNEYAAASVTSGTVASTFTFDGAGGTSGSITMSWQKIGNWVTLNVPAVTATTGTGSTNLSSNTALPASVRPSATQAQSATGIVNNGAGVSTPGSIQVNSSGAVLIYRDSTAAAYTNSATAGTNAKQSITYFAG